MNRREQLSRHKAVLLGEIHQQRLDLQRSCEDWTDATTSLDRGWFTLLNLRTWLMAGSGVMAVWSVRHPRFLGRVARRGLGIWSTWRLVRKAMGQLQR